MILKGGGVTEARGGGTVQPHAQVLRTRLGGLPDRPVGPMGGGSGGGNRRAGAAVRATARGASGLRLLPNVRLRSGGLQSARSAVVGENLLGSFHLRGCTHRRNNCERLTGGVGNRRAQTANWLHISAAACLRGCITTASHR